MHPLLFALAVWGVAWAGAVAGAYAEGGIAPVAASAAAIAPLFLPKETKVPVRIAQAVTADTTPALPADAGSAGGAQALLLEATGVGASTALSFPGTVAWSAGTDAAGEPTLLGRAEIPGRKLSLDLLIRPNSDPGIPASHLVDLTFQVDPELVDGSIASVPFLLLKTGQPARDTPLVGASARITANRFLFALSAAPTDAEKNVQLLTSQGLLEVALVYATGRRALISLPKDQPAEKLFADAFASWSASHRAPDGRLAGTGAPAGGEAAPSGNATAEAGPAGPPVAVDLSGKVLDGVKVPVPMPRLKGR